MIYQLDTDHVSLLQRAGTGAAALQARLSRLGPDDYGAAVVSYEEQCSGWAAQVARAQTPAQRLEAYAQFKANLRFFCGIAVWDYTPAADVIYSRLKAATLRVGTKDLQIAAVALANGTTLLSRNGRDFNKVPGLQVEDWAA